MPLSVLLTTSQLPERVYAMDLLSLLPLRLHFITTYNHEHITIRAETPYLHYVHATHTVFIEPTRNGEPCWQEIQLPMWLWFYETTLLIDLFTNLYKYTV